LPSAGETCILINMRIRPFSTTGIGSLPHLDPKEACKAALESFDIPFWPQLPQASFREGMIAQFAEGLPGLRVDMERGSIWVEDDAEAVGKFYESCTGDAEIPISVEYASGLYAFLDEIKGRRFEQVKGHVTGPLTFSLSLKDKGGRPVYFNEELREICLMLLKAKTRWQVGALKPYAGGVIIFIDEPILSALGSTTYISVERQEALRLLSELVETVKAAGATPGVHCCGRAEWPLLIEAGVDILHFDAYEYGDTLGIYPDAIKGFMEAGGILGWGIVPTTDAIGGETLQSLTRLFYERLDGLSGHIPKELLLRNIILTPSCGTGSRSIGEAMKVFGLLGALKKEVSK